MNASPARYLLLLYSFFSTPVRRTIREDVFLQDVFKTIKKHGAARCVVKSLDNLQDVRTETTRCDPFCFKKTIYTLQFLDTRKRYTNNNT